MPGNKKSDLDQQQTMRLNVFSASDEDSHVSVVLSKRQLSYLDRLIGDIEKKTGCELKHGEVVRALIDALTWSGADETAAAALYGHEALTPKKRGEAPSSARVSEVLRDVLTELMSG
ncbi:MAG: hypothetical protein JXR83_01720 [Deltaproteobacteria bacterium]|nr:hypothetical protein [Deltaproteobacteria bacterium]